MFGHYFPEARGKLSSYTTRSVTSSLSVRRGTSAVLSHSIGVASPKSVVTLAKVFARILSFVWRFRIISWCFSVSVHDSHCRRSHDTQAGISFAYGGFVLTPHLPHANEIKEFLEHFPFWNERSGRQSLVTVSLRVVSLFFGADACYKCVGKR